MIDKRKKEKILAKIDEAIMFEEMAVPVYSSHFGEALFWSKIDPKKKEKIIEGLKILSAESKKHIKLLKKARRIFFRED